MINPLSLSFDSADRKAVKRPLDNPFVEDSNVNLFAVNFNSSAASKYDCMLKKINAHKKSHGDKRYNYSYEGIVHDGAERKRPFLYECSVCLTNDANMSLLISTAFYSASEAKSIDKFLEQNKSFLISFDAIDMERSLPLLSTKFCLKKLCK